MLLHSILIQKNNVKVTVDLTDKLHDITKKIRKELNKELSITKYNNWEYKTIEFGKLQIYEDCNTSLMLIFDKNDSLVAIHQSDYTPEKNVIKICCKDNSDNIVYIDCVREEVCKITTESIMIEDEDTNIHREILDSQVGKWVLAYLEMEESFTTITLVLKEHADEIEYELFGVNILTIN